MLGHPPITLDDGEFATQWQTIATPEERAEYLSTHTKLETDAGVLNLASQPAYTEPMGETIYNSYTDVLYILPDAVCQQLLPVMRNRYICTADPISFRSAQEMGKLFSNTYPEAVSYTHLDVYKRQAVCLAFVKQNAGDGRFLSERFFMSKHSKRRKKVRLNSNVWLWVCLALGAVCLGILGLQKIWGTNSAVSGEDWRPQVGAPPYRVAIDAGHGGDAVSYTHLDVYKRQGFPDASGPACDGL